MTISAGSKTNNSGTFATSFTANMGVSPKGALVLVAAYGGDNESVSAVSIGSESLTEVGASPGVGAGAELPNQRCSAWFLPTGAPSGNQTVAVTGPSACLTLVVPLSTAGGDIEEVDSDAVSSASASNPSVSLSAGGRDCFAAVVWQSGHDAVGSVSPLSGWSSDVEFDVGTFVCGAYTRTAISSSDTTAGVTQTANDIALIGVLLAEEASADNVNVETNVDALTLTENAASITLDIGINAGTDSLAITGNAATVSLGVNIAAGTDALAITENAASITFDVGISASTDELTLATFGATIGGSTDISAGVHNLTLTANAASIAFDVNVGAGTDALTVSGQTATIALGVNILAGVDSLAITANAASITSNLNIGAGLDALTLTTHQSSIDGGVPQIEITARIRYESARTRTAPAETNVRAGTTSETHIRAYARPQ